MTARVSKLFNRLSSIALSLSLAVGIVTPSAAQEPGSRGWITSWATAMQDPLPAGFAVGNPPVTSSDWKQMFPDNQVSDQSFRMIVRPQAPGQRVRLRFSNLMGSKPVTFDGVSIATRSSNKSLVAGTSVQLTFNGATKVTIARATEVFCDAVAFDVVPERDVAVSFHVVGDSGPITWHAKAMTTSYLSAPGAGAQLNDAGTSLVSEVRSWLWLTELQAFQPDSERHAIVAVGDSITDGSGTTIDGNDRWEDFLNKRLRAAGSANVVVNEGIGGNRVVTMPWGPVLSGAYTSEAKLADHSGAPNTTDARCDGCGEPAVVRLDRDVFGLPNVSAVILFEGVNDIGAGASYAQVIAGMQDIVQRAHARGIKVFAATITPYYGFAYDQVYPDLIRQQVNTWIRTGKAFDAVFDFDAAVRDPGYPARIKVEYSAPDHIHLNPAGYEKAASTVTLADLDGNIKQ